MTGLLNKATQGDCLEVMRDIPDKSVDMILCDLPYGTTAAKWDSVIPFDFLWAEYERVIKDNGAIVLTAAQPFTSKLILSNEKLFRQCLVWEKDRPSDPALAKKRFMKWHEDICIFYKKLPTFNAQMRLRDVKNKRNNNKDVMHRTETKGDFLHKRGDGLGDLVYPKSVLPVNVVNPNGKEKVAHSTQKPVALFEYLIRTYTNEGEVVLDNCLGSGTTAVAAINTGRQFIGIEREQEYVDIANERIQAAYDAKLTQMEAE